MKTLLDLYNSAAAAAATTLEMNTTLEVDTAALDSFHADKGDARDYDQWRLVFNNVRGELLRMSKVPTTSAAEEAKLLEEAKAAASKGN